VQDRDTACVKKPEDLQSRPQNTSTGLDSQINIIFNLLFSNYMPICDQALQVASSSKATQIFLEFLTSTERETFTSQDNSFIITSHKMYDRSQLVKTHVAYVTLQRILLSTVNTGVPYICQLDCHST
jgi:hypothetical protein